jgi:hypothetical protein
MTAPQTQARLTIHDQLLINLCGWLSVSQSDDPTLDLMLSQLRRVLPSCSDHNRLVARLAGAALALLRVIDAPDGRRNLAACSEAFQMRQALQSIFLARAAQACAAIWPDENSQPQPAPAFEPGTASEPAHAQVE